MAKKIVISALLIIFFLGLLATGIYFGFIQQAVIPTQTNQFNSYTDVPREGSQCDIQDWWDNYNLISSSIAVIPTLSSTFRFETTSHISKPIYACIENPSTIANAIDITEIYIDESGCQHWSYKIFSQQHWTPGSTNIQPDVCHCNNPSFSTFGGINDNRICFAPKDMICGGISFWDYHAEVSETINDYGGLKQVDSEDGCFYSAKVYKDEILIDEINISEEPLQKAYSDDGTVYFGDLLPTDSGLEVQFGERAFYTPSCADQLKCQIKNSYETYLQKDYITINISSLKETYLEGEIIKIIIDIENNFDLVLSGELEIKYEVPTIIGPKVEIEKYPNLIINPGDNKFTYNIPTDIRTESLDITPTIKIYRLTSRYSGINVLQGFEEFGIDRGPITANDKLRVYLLTEDTKTIIIEEDNQALLDLLKQYEDDLEELQNQISQLNLTLNEKIDLVSQLNLTIEEKQLIIDKLEQEEKPNYLIWIIVGGIVLLLLIIIGVLLLRKER